MAWNFPFSVQKCIRDNVIPIAHDYFIEIYQTLRALGQTKKLTTLKNRWCSNRVQSEVRFRGIYKQ
ncbi:hypothetical protein KoxyNG13_047970 [Klebsiella pasteurii]